MVDANCYNFGSTQSRRKLQLLKDDFDFSKSQNYSLFGKKCNFGVLFFIDHDDLHWSHG
jgi:hypothetical protein